MTLDEYLHALGLDEQHRHFARDWQARGWSVQEVLTRRCADCGAILEVHITAMWRFRPHVIRCPHCQRLGRDDLCRAIARIGERAGVVEQEQIAVLNSDRQGVLEPRILESLVAVGYRLAGGERLWIPRFLSSLFWILGSGFLFLLGRKVSREPGALFAVAFYLFLPFGVLASRSFQPDPLMVMLLLASIYAIVMFTEQQTTSWMIASYALSGSALLVKPVTAFVIYVVFGLLAIQSFGLKRSISDWRVFLFVPASLLPSVAFYVPRILGGGTLTSQAGASFLPHLLTTSFFWLGWLDNLRNVVGLPVFFVALLGVLLVEETEKRLLLTGLWCGAPAGSATAILAETGPCPQALS